MRLPAALLAPTVVLAAGPGAVRDAPRVAGPQAVHQAAHPVAAHAASRVVPRPFAHRGQRFALTSQDVAPGARIAERHVFNGFGCSGQNVSPALAWSGAPAGTKSFAVTVYDPDAPTGSGWWHWVVYNIPAGSTELPTGAGAGTSGGLPAGAVQGVTDFGAAGYGGPCPPQGDAPHRYVFTVHALKVEHLELPANATAAFIGFNLAANRLGSATFTVRYGR